MTNEEEREELFSVERTEAGRIFASASLGGHVGHLIMTEATARKVHRALGIVLAAEPQRSGHSVGTRLKGEINADREDDVEAGADVGDCGVRVRPSGQQSLSQTEGEAVRALPVQETQGAHSAPDVSAIRSSDVTAAVNETRVVYQECVPTNAYGQRAWKTTRCVHYDADSRYTDGKCSFEREEPCEYATRSNEAEASVTKENGADGNILDEIERLVRTRYASSELLTLVRRLRGERADKAIAAPDLASFLGTVMRRLKEELKCAETARHTEGYARGLAHAINVVRDMHAEQRFGEAANAPPASQVQRWWLALEDEHDPSPFAWRAESDAHEEAGVSGVVLGPLVLESAIRSDYPQAELAITLEKNFRARGSSDRDTAISARRRGDYEIARQWDRDADFWYRAADMVTKSARDVCSDSAEVASERIAESNCGPKERSQ